MPIRMLSEVRLQFLAAVAVLDRIPESQVEWLPRDLVDSPVMVIPARFPTPAAGWIRSDTDRSASTSTAAAETASGSGGGDDG